MDETFNWFILNQSNTRKSFEQTQSQARIASLTLCDQHQKACVCVKKILDKKKAQRLVQFLEKKGFSKKLKSPLETLAVLSPP